MYKKAGIVVGIALFVVAGLLYWWFGGSHDKKSGGENSSPVSYAQPQPSASQPTASVQQPTQSAPVGVSEPVQSAPVDEPKKTFIEVDDAQVKKELGDPVTTRKELMVVSKKKLVVMDSDVSSKAGKQMVYAIDLLGSNNSTTLTVYLNGAAYQGVSIGDRLMVEYAIYKNKVGVELPVVISVEKSQ